MVQAVGDEVLGVCEGDRVTLLGEHAFATHADVDATKVVPLPAALAGRPFPGEPLACAWNVLARCGIEPGLLTHQFSLDELDAAFETMLARPEGFVKAVVCHE